LRGAPGIIGVDNFTLAEGVVHGVVSHVACCEKSIWMDSVVGSRGRKSAVWSFGGAWSPIESSPSTLKLQNDRVHNWFPEDLLVTAKRTESRVRAKVQ